MAKKKRYIFNPKTLIYEVEKASRKSRILKSLAFFACSIGLATLYFWLYTSVLGLELPKTLLLKKANAELVSRTEVLNRQLDRYDNVLSTLQMRDDGIYRSIFGMNEIPSDVRNAGFGGVNRYAHYSNGMLKNTAVRIDVLTKKAYIQNATKLIIPSELTNLASTLASASEIVKENKNGRKEQIKKLELFGSSNFFSYICIVIKRK